ncbi:unannotated protein [freshwater metagenome]|uniref:Unannotated protein n=1 Tax=freshwater metagenome TaxID=449393 RepID=A0A6J7H5H4_9ZZZZ|nr:hypothetical protein [Actinomycetota bacterium]
MTEDQTSTGRLFRAASVDDEVHTDAIPALPSERARVEDVLPDEAFRAEVPVATVAVLDEVTPEVREQSVPALSPNSPFTNTTASAPESSAPVPLATDSGLSTRWVWVIIVGVTVLMAIADILIRKQGIGWVTGVGLLAATVYCAMASQRASMWWSAIAPPLAIAFTILTVGQATLTRSNSLVISETLNLLDSLGRAAPFILASVIAALVTCFVRRSRARRN